MELGRQSDRGVDERELYHELYGSDAPEGITDQELNLAVSDNRGEYRTPVRVGQIIDLRPPGFSL